MIDCLQESDVVVRTFIRYELNIVSMECSVADLLSAFESCCIVFLLLKCLCVHCSSTLTSRNYSDGHIKMFSASIRSLSGS